MDWKETVMSIDEFATVTGLSPDAEYMYNAALPELTRQAQITGDIAYKAGMKEVVDWVDSAMGLTPNNTPPLTKHNWQEFKKEQGIE